MNWIGIIVVTIFCVFIAMITYFVVTWFESAINHIEEGIWEIVKMLRKQTGEEKETKGGETQ